MVIFLYVDGVLNRKADWAKPFNLNPSCVQAFMQLVRKLEKRGAVEIVLSSSWWAGLEKGSDESLIQDPQAVHLYLVYYRLGLTKKDSRRILGGR